MKITVSEDAGDEGLYSILHLLQVKAFMVTQNGAAPPREALLDRVEFDDKGALVLQVRWWDEARGDYTPDTEGLPTVTIKELMYL